MSSSLSNVRDITYDLLPINQADLADRVHSILKDQILTQSLSSGSQISVDVMARSLRVSRTPVLEALQRLHAEGLVIIKPRKGTFVKPLTIQDFIEAVDLREYLEIYSAKLAIDKVTEEEIAALRALAAEFAPFYDAAGRRTDIAGFSRKNAEFHDYHFGMSKNVKLLQIYRSLNIDVIQSRIYFRSEARSALQVNEEHLAIVHAYERRDLARLTAAISVHCQRGKQAMLAILEQAGGSL
ncbi:MAG: GntR family transcriptional regulator [Chloroflexi bacterium]|nr:GntR family transcriptional regulator [Chloroflexota bacterium]